MAQTKIGWTDRTWNPTTGCTKVSAGCKFCYAERMAKRLAGRVGYPPAPHQFDLTLHPERLDYPSHLKNPSMIFVDSMSDLFHKDVPDIFIREVFEKMAQNSRHIFQILTKRPQRMAELLGEWYSEYALTNVWAGTSIENQEAADDRIPWLVKTPAVCRFLSCEPMLGPVNLDWSVNRNNFGPYQWGLDRGLSWLIVGCESGPRRRPMQIQWALDLVRQCRIAGVPVFMKQMEIDGKVSHNLSDFPQELQVREFPEYPECKYVRT